MKKCDRESAHRQTDTLTHRVPVKLNLSDVQDAEAFNFRHPVMPRHQNLGVHSHWLFYTNFCTD